MLDMKLIRNETESVKERLATRGVDPSEIDALIADDAKRRELLVQTEELKARRNTVSDEIGLKKRNKEDASETIAEMQAVSAKIKELDEEVAKVDEAIQDRMLHFLTCQTQRFQLVLTKKLTAKSVLGEKFLHSTSSQRPTTKLVKTLVSWTGSAVLRLPVLALSTTLAKVPA